MSEDSLKNKTKKSFLWSGIDRIATQLTQFLFGLLLARLLTPEDYGIIAMPLIFLEVAQCFIDCGFTTAIVRKTDLREDDLSTAFYFNIVVGIFFYMVLFVSSPLIADFYNTPILESLLRVTALATLFNPLCAVQQSILTRALNFKIQAKISLTGSIISGIAGVVMAFYGCGVWSLVVQQVGAYAIRTLMLWVYSQWYPKTGWSKESFNYLWNFGSKMLASGLINTVYNNIAPVFIGKYYTSAALGNYTRARQFANLPANNFTGILDRITIPVLSKIQNDSIRLENAYRRLIRLSAFIIFPVMMALAAMAKPLILIILGEKWYDCILLLQIICFSSMWLPIHSMNLSLLGVKGRSDYFLRLEIIKKSIGLMVLAITLPLGIFWFVCSFFVTSVIGLIINSYYTGKLINVTFLVQMKDITKSFVLAVSMFGFVLGINYVIPSLYLQVIVDTIICFGYYLGLAKACNFSELTEMLELLPVSVRNKLKRN